MQDLVLVINPNSDRNVTGALDRAVSGLRLQSGPVIECTTLSEGPLGIETPQHVQAVIAPLTQIIRSRNASAYVIACFSDPGLEEVRQVTTRPVFGICQAGLTTALNHGRKVGILTNVAEDIAPTWQQLEDLGLASRVGAVEAIGVPVTELGDRERALDALTRAARKLQKTGVDVAVTGCAGMSPYGADVEAATGLTIIDPTYAATAMALSAVLARRGKQYD